MKRILFLIMLLCAVGACSQPGVDNHELEGNWDAMKLDKPKLEFTAEGGVDTVTVKNYTSWWVSGGYNLKRDENGIGTQDGKYYHPTRFVFLDAEWFQALVPDNGKSNQVIVTVDANTLGKPREAILEMTGGDIFSHILIYQQ
ncbi:MAG: BACON domain-containing protein [Bacteroidales bacterium]|nr:BACON domain-containing protein [Bacteroidales bacterium]